MYKSIEEENRILLGILIEESKKVGLDQIIEIIGNHLTLSLSRKQTLRELVLGVESLNTYFKNDFLQCLVKNLFESQGRIEDYRAFEFSDKHDLSNSFMWSYDPPKNGQNILKHGLEFGAVATYSGDNFGRLMVYMAPKIVIYKNGKKKKEKRAVVFSKYYAQNASKKFFLNSYKSDDVFCVASIISDEEDIIKFISSRVIKVKTTKQLIKELRNLIKDKDLDEIDETIIPELREKSLTILKEFYDFKLEN